MCSSAIDSIPVVRCLLLVGTNSWMLNCSSAICYPNRADWRNLWSASCKSSLFLCATHLRATLKRQMQMKSANIILSCLFRGYQLYRYTQGHTLWTGCGDHARCRYVCKVQSNRRNQYIFHAADKFMNRSHRFIPPRSVFQRGVLIKPWLQCSCVSRTWSGAIKWLNTFWIGVFGISRCATGCALPSISTLQLHSSCLICSTRYNIKLDGWPRSVGRYCCITCTVHGECSGTGRDERYIWWLISFVGFRIIYFDDFEGDAMHARRSGPFIAHWRSKTPKKKPRRKK